MTGRTEQGLTEHGITETVQALMADPRVALDSFIVYPTDYDLIPYADRDNWALTVENGHAWGWRIVPGIGRSGGNFVIDRDGRRVLETRGDEENAARRWPLEEALAIALDVVDTKHAVHRLTAAEAIKNREAILASFDQPAHQPGADR